MDNEENSAETDIRNKEMDDMEQKNRKKEHVFIAIICVLAVIVIAQFVLILNNKEVETKKETTKEASQDISKDTEKELVLNKIEMPIADLTYNEEAVDNIKVKYTETKPYRITFLADIGGTKNIELFSLYFDGDQGTYIGKIKDKKDNLVKVSLTKNIFSTALGISESEAERLTSTQEDLIDNVVASMTLEEKAEETAQEELEQSCMKIDTPYAQLLYPVTWEKYLKVETDENSGEVKFYCQFSDKDKKELFTYTFGKASDILVGHLNDMEVGLSIGTEEPDESWTEDEIETFYSMREDMNIIIDGLTNTDGFVLERNNNEKN